MYHIVRFSCNRGAYTYEMKRQKIVVLPRTLSQNPARPAANILPLLSTNSCFNDDCCYSGVFLFLNRLVVQYPYKVSFLGDKLLYKLFV